jgi:hypothetical protein
MPPAAGSCGAGPVTSSRDRCQTAVPRGKSTLTSPHGASPLVRSFFAYEPDFREGVYVVGADVNGDGKADIVTGTGVGGGPLVKVFDGARGSLLASFFAYESTFRGGVVATAADIDGDGKAEIITGAGVGGGPLVKVWDAVTGTLRLSFRLRVELPRRSQRGRGRPGR